MFENFCKVPLASKGFFCLSLKASCVIIGALELPLCGFLYLMKFMSLIMHSFAKYQTAEHQTMIYFIGVGILMEFAVAATAILLIIGALKGTESLVFINLVAFSLSGLLTPIMIYELWFEEPMLICIWAVVYCYFVHTTYSFLIELRMKSGKGVVVSMVNFKSIEKNMQFDKLEEGDG